MSESYFTVARAKKNMEYYEDYSHKPYGTVYDACMEIILLNEELTRLREQNKLLRRVREYWQNRFDQRVDDYVELLGESYKLREQVRYRGIGEEQPSEGEEIITIDDNLSANLICYFSEEKEHWINQGVRWIPVPLPQPPEDE